MPNSAEGESSQAPSKAPPVAAPQDANVFMSSFLETMTDLMEILIAQLEPNEAKVVKRLSIKILPSKAF